MRHRWYDPEMGQFLTRDPLGQWGDPLNLGHGTLYPGHDPVNFVDPYGLNGEGCYSVLDSLNDKGMTMSTLARIANDPKLARQTGHYPVYEFLNLEEADQRVFLERMQYAANFNAAAERLHEAGKLAEELTMAVGAEVVTAGIAPAGEAAAVRMAQKLAKLFDEARDARRAGGAVSAGRGASNPACATTNRIASGAENVNSSDALASKISALQSAQKDAARTRVLPDGRIRYHDPEKPSKTPGRTRGSSYTTEWDPKSGHVRSWQESYDHAGNVIRVHPKMINGQQVKAPHYPPTGSELGR